MPPPAASWKKMSIEEIKNRCLALGFDAVGFAPPELPAQAKAGLQEFIIVVGHNYGPEFDPMDKLAQRGRGNISCYALNEDYHEVIKKKLKALARWVAETYGCEVKVFVDTAPVMEKALAAAAGLGWQ